jgi:phosphoribosylformylglycinamidine cyclo-ligase
LVRHALFEIGGLPLDSSPAELGGSTLADELLIPTRIYSLDCLALAAEAGAHAFAHITGGGLAGNLVRVLPAGITAVIDRGTWAPQPIFDLIARTGSVPLDQLELTFNLGVGMVAVVPADRADDALALCTARGVPAWRLGTITGSAESSKTPPVVSLTGHYQGVAAAWR